VGVIATDEVLVEGLAEARDLIEQGEYEAALDALTRMSESAVARHDPDLLDEVRPLAKRVSERALKRGDRERADVLRRAVTSELLADAASADRSWRGAMKYVVWTLVIWSPIIPLAGFLASLPSGWTVFGASSGDAVAFLVFGIGFPIYVVVLAVMLLWDRSRGRWSDEGS
jgi:hypothetical protein